MCDSVKILPYMTSPQVRELGTGCHDDIKGGEHHGGLYVTDKNDSVVGSAKDWGFH